MKTVQISLPNRVQDVRLEFVEFTTQGFVLSVINPNAYDTEIGRIRQNPDGLTLFHENNEYPHSDFNLYSAIRRLFCIIEGTFTFIQIGTLSIYQAFDFRSETSFTAKKIVSSVGLPWALVIEPKSGILPESIPTDSFYATLLEAQIAATRFSDQIAA